MPKRRTLVFIALAIIAIGVGIYLCWPRSPRFTEEQFARIHNGMTLAEVEAVLGCPPGNYSADGQLLILVEIETAKPGQVAAFGRQWACDLPGGNRKLNEQPALGVSVHFNADGRVTDKDRVFYMYIPPTLLERLRTWMGW
jgi:hypothetical protein